jgi:hypothetical protein
VDPSVENTIIKLKKLYKILMLVYIAFMILCAITFFYTGNEVYKGVTISLFPLLIYGIIKENSFYHSLSNLMLSEKSNLEKSKIIKTDFLRALNYFDIMTLVFVVGIVIALVGGLLDIKFLSGNGMGLVLFAAILMFNDLIVNFLVEIMAHELTQKSGSV